MEHNSILTLHKLKLQVSTNGKTIALNSLDDFSEITAATLKELKNIVIKQNLMTCRICLHKGGQDSSCHEMIIVQKRGIAPFIHKHLTKGESYQILEGQLKIEIYNEQFQVTSEILMGFEENQTLIYRIPKNVWHSTTPVSDYIIFKETRSGPFEANDTVEKK